MHQSIYRYFAQPLLHPNKDEREKMLETIRVQQQPQLLASASAPADSLQVADAGQADAKQSAARQPDPKQSHASRQADPEQSNARQADPKQSTARQADPKQTRARQGSAPQVQSSPVEAPSVQGPAVSDAGEDMSDDGYETEACIWCRQLGPCHADLMLSITAYLCLYLPQRNTI